MKTGRTVPPQTPDGRYIVVRGRLWRRTNPALPEETRAALVLDLMQARRDVAQARKTSDQALAHDSHQRVQAVKEALGERGPVWWTDGMPDYNRHMAVNTPYREWYEAMQHETNDERRKSDVRFSSRV